MATNKKNYDYEDLVNEFGENKIKERYIKTYECLESFIERNNYKENLEIVPSVLNQVIIDYFVDIYRLKDFHKIDHANFLKIHAYMGYWINRRKPLQIIKDDVNKVNLAFANESFVALYLIRYTRGDEIDVKLLDEVKQDYFEFYENLEYFLRYRTVTPQMLETMLEAFNAGKAFQKSADIYNNAGK